MTYPGPSPNGGLYTGEPFAPGAPWANVPIVPDAATMIQDALATARPPPGAAAQHQLGLRPGNNDPPPMRGLLYDAANGLVLVAPRADAAPPAAPRFRKHAYIH